jgi:hypothetical protein
MGKELTKKEKYLKTLSEKYPDKDFADEEVLFSQIHEDFDGVNQELGAYKEREKTLGDLFASNPRSASFFIEWRKGGDPIVEMIRRYGDDFKTALEDPEKQNEIAQANKEFAERVAQEQEFETQYQNNMQETLSMLNEVQTENDLTDDDIDNAMEFLFGVMKDAIVGKFSKESVLMALKAINHDIDVEQADREGEVRGRNAKIEEKLKRQRKTDGTAQLGGSNNVRQPKREDFGALDRNYGSSNIWERGGEVRRKYN